MSATVALFRKAETDASDPVAALAFETAKSTAEANPPAGATEPMLGPKARPGTGANPTRHAALKGSSGAEAFGVLALLSTANPFDQADWRFS